jgi:hypothetical protein
LRTSDLFLITDFVPAFRVSVKKCTMIMAEKMCSANSGMAWRRLSRTPSTK